MIVRVRTEDEADSLDFCEVEGFRDFEALCDTIAHKGFYDQEHGENLPYVAHQFVFDSKHGIHFAEIILEAPNAD